MLQPRISPGTAFVPVGARVARFPTLAGDLEVDVAIVGAGVTGLGLARLLAGSGLGVAVLEGHRVGGGTTGSSTGQLTSLVDDGYVALESDFGVEAAKAVAALTVEAMDAVERWVREDEIFCSLRRVPAFLFAEAEKDQAELEKEAAAAARAGLGVRAIDPAEMPFAVRAAQRLENQIDFDPSAYVQGLAQRMPANVRVFEDTRVESIEDGEPLVVKTAHGTVRARWVVEARHVPGGMGMLHAKTAAYRSYVVAARAERPLRPGIYADLKVPYHYLREHEGLIVLGGEDHKAGQRPDDAHPFDALEAYLGERFGAFEVTARWSAELYAPVDGLPYIGPMHADSKHLVATGFDGDGLLFGTVAATLLSEHMLGRKHPHASLFDPSRTKVLASAKQFVKEQANVALHMVSDRIAGAPASADAIAPGCGGIVDLDGHRCAVYREATTGELHVRSATCPHAGGVVQWNPDSRTFDCPLHGGSFSPTGEVLAGPPGKNLDPPKT